MLLRFRKLPGQRHEIEVTARPVGPDLRLPARETGPTMPHDLVHAAVEQALRLRDGFWATVAKGAMFEGFELLQPSRHRRAGIKVLQRYGDDAAPAELAVSWAHRVWSGQRAAGRGLGVNPLSPEQQRLASAALDAAQARWNAVPEGAALDWDWDPGSS